MKQGGVVDYIQAKVYTSILHTDMRLYSVSNYPLARPIAYRSVFYGLIGAILWTLPCFLIFGVGFLLNGTIYPVLLYFAPPVLLGCMVTQPWFFGKTFDRFLLSLAKYTTYAPIYTDTVSWDFHNTDIDSDYDLWLGDIEDFEPQKKRKSGKKKQNRKSNVHPVERSRKK